MNQQTAHSVTVRRPTSGRLLADIRLPGSKSITNRALALAALGGRPLTLFGASDSADSRVMRRFLEQLGWTVAVDDTRWQLTPPSAPPDPARTVTVDLEQAGTAARFLTAVCTRLPGTFVLDGTERLRLRPMAPLVAALTAAGAEIESLGEPGQLPLRIVGRPDTRPMHFTVSAALSSQLASALLLLAPALGSGSRVTLAGSLASEPYLQMTVGLCRSFGAGWQAELDQPRDWTLVHEGAAPDSFEVEGDWSAASYWLGLAATLPSELRLRALNPASLQGDAAQLRHFLHFGLELRFDGGVMTVVNTQGNLIRPFDLDFSLMPDLAQTFAVLALFADAGPSHLAGLDTLPLKETDRLEALVAELGSTGAEALVTQGTRGLGLSVNPTQSHPPARPIATYDDHRMAMAFALLANRFERVVIRHPGVVVKSYPLFWNHLASAGYQVQFD